MPNCPACDAPLRSGPEPTQCDCGQWVRFEEVPERPCDQCGTAIALVGDAVRCPGCGRLQAADPSRAVRVVARCPRCRRQVDVDAEAATDTCGPCGQVFHLQDTL